MWWRRSGAVPVPRWVWVSLGVVAVVLVAVVVLMLAGGEHGPGRHLSGPVAGIAAQVL